MKKELIKDKLERDGYCIVESGEVVIVGKYRETDIELGMVIYDAYCSVKDLNGQIVIEYSNNAIPLEKVFESEVEGISFIQRSFPL